MGLATGQGARAPAGAWQRAPKSGASSEVPAFQVVPRRDRNQWRPVRTQGRSSTSQAAGVNEPLGIPTFDGDLFKHLLIVQLEYSNKVGSVIPSLIARNRKRHRTPRCFVPDPTLPFGIAAARRSTWCAIPLGDRRALCCTAHATQRPRCRAQGQQARRP